MALYLSQVRRVWNHLPDSARPRSLGRACGKHLHAVVRLHAERRQYFATFFLRNRAELELMQRLADRKPYGSRLRVAVLACSKGAEVYSVAWAIRSARKDLQLELHALDISQEILDFAAKGIYSLASPDALAASDEGAIRRRGNISWNTSRDQRESMFTRMTNEEIAAMFEVKGAQAQIRPWLAEGITWRRGDAGDAEIADTLGPQDIVVANRFLCHMHPAAAERCLRNIARLVKPGGYLFVSGVDLNIRTKVAQEMGWKPLVDLIKEIHQGDPSLERGWPLEYWGLEPFDVRRPDWEIRYASVFQLGENNRTAS